MRGSKRPRPFIHAARWGGRPSTRLAAVLLALWSVSAGAGGRPLLPADHHEGADPLAFYAANIAAQVVQAKCVNCHVAGGPATGRPCGSRAGSGSAVVEGNFQAFSNYVAADSARIARTPVQGARSGWATAAVSRSHPGSRDLRNLECVSRSAATGRPGGGCRTHRCRRLRGARFSSARMPIPSPQAAASSTPSTRRLAPWT